MAKIVIPIGTSIVAEIAKYLVKPTLRQLRYMFCFNNIVEDLRQENRKLTEAQEQVQIDVQRARGNGEEIRKDVEEWLTESNAVIEDVKRLENEAQDNKSCLNGWCSKWCCRYRLSRKAAKKKLAIIKLQEDGKFTQVGDPASLPNRGFFSSADFLSSKATESVTHQIMEALKDENVNMIGLHGMGGVGKTTLVKELGGRAKDLKLFDVVVIAVVSQTPNVKNIQGQIADPLRLEFREETESGRAGRLRVRLKSENKILIILDDVWASLDLTDIGIPFGNDHKGCKILLTTRRLHVCTAMKSQKTIKLDVLLEDEAWALFKKNTGLGNDSSTLTSVAREVARECKGLPLAIVTVGRALRGKTLDEYTEALEQLKNSRFVNIADADEDIYKCLKLSYDYLKGKEIQSCFLLCSLFPEDYEMDIEDLARIGWGIGLFQEAETIEAARRKMRVMMYTLQNSGLLIDTNRDQFVKMHDMVRDVALWIASEGENVFMVRTGAGLKTWPHDRSLESYTAISLMANDIKELPNGLVCPNLNTLLLGGGVSNFDTWFSRGGGVSMTISDVFFEEMKALKVLSVYKGILVPQSLQFLTNLQTLHLDYCKFNDISSLGKLKKLGILRLCGSDIEELPNEIGELNNLRLLDVNGCHNLERIPPNVISKLSKLEELYIEFSTHRWEYVSVKLACDWLCELNSLFHLAVLSLQFDAKYLPIDFAFPKLARYNINMFNLRMEYPTTKTLGFKDIDATSLNAFKELFPAVEYLHLESAAGFQNIIPNMEQGGLNNLISLDLDSCREMECLIDSTQQQPVTTQIAFSNLVKLSLGGMTHLREICFGNQLPEGFLQKLKTLEVKRCRNVFSIFPKQLLERLRNLEEVTVHECEKVQEVFGLEGPTHHVAEGNHVMLLSNLTSLDLSYLPELKCIWKGPTHHVSFESLRDVKIGSCERLTYLFSSSLAQSLVHLQILTIQSCKGLEQIITTEKEDEEISSEAHLQPLCFPKLTTIEIKNCEKLEYIFPISVAKDLRLLEELIISDAPQLKQVFGHGREEDLFVGDGNDIVLPKLRELKLKTLTLRVERASQFEEVFRHENEEDVRDEIKIVLQRLLTLELEDLPRLISFCPGGYHFIFPSLSELRVMKCPNIPMSFTIDSDRSVHAKVKAKAEVQVFGREGPTHHVAERNHVMLLSNLRRLDLGELPELRCIWKGPTQHVSLQSLQNVEVWGCERLTYLFSSSIARSLVQLQRLTIRSCKGLEQIIMTEKKDGEISSEAHLQPLCFPQLTTIRIKYCEKLEYIFPISVAQDLQLLEELIISDAPQLKQVFGHGRKDDLFVGDGNDIVLPKLRELKLKRLSSLTRFYESNYHWVWPSLQKLIVMECPKLTAFFITDLEAKLTALQKQLRVLRISNHIQLHKAGILLQGQGLVKLEELQIENCEEVQEVFHGISTDGDSNLKKLILKDLPELRFIWKGPTQISSFQNLTHIDVINCNKLMHVFSPSVARNLLRLEWLDISGCEELERIIGEEDKDEEDQIISSKGHLQQPICFPNLRYIWVKGCNKLKSLFPISIAGGLPQLELLSVESASQFEEVFRHENEEDVRDEKTIVLQELSNLTLKDLPRLISFCPGGYHFIFPSLEYLKVKGCLNITMSFTIDSDRSVHAKVKAKAEAPQLGKEDMSEGSSTTQATVATMPNDSDNDNDIYIQWLRSLEWAPLPPPSYSNINWNRYFEEYTLPPYVEESPGSL